MTEKPGFEDVVRGAVDKFGNQIGEAIEKAGDVIDQKTGGKFSDQIGVGEEKVGDLLDGLDGQNDDIGAEPAPEPAPAPTEPGTEPTAQ